MKTEIVLSDYQLRKLAKWEAEYRHALLKEDPELMDELYPPRWMGYKQAALYSGIPESTLRHKIDEIPHEKVGKRVVFSDRGLTRWLMRKTKK